MHGQNSIKVHFTNNRFYWKQSSFCMPRIPQTTGRDHSSTDTGSGNWLVTGDFVAVPTPPAFELEADYPKVLFWTRKEWDTFVEHRKLENCRTLSSLTKMETPMWHVTWACLLVDSAIATCLSYLINSFILSLSQSTRHCLTLPPYALSQTFFLFPTHPHLHHHLLAPHTYYPPEPNGPNLVEEDWWKGFICPLHWPSPCGAVDI